MTLGVGGRVWNDPIQGLLFRCLWRLCSQVERHSAVPFILLSCPTETCQREAETVELENHPVWTRPPNSLCTLCYVACRQRFPTPSSLSIAQKILRPSKTWSIPAPGPEGQGMGHGTTSLPESQPQSLDVGMQAAKPEGEGLQTQD